MAHSLRMIAVGKIVKSAGVKGECKVVLLTDTRSGLDGLATVWVGPSEGATERRILESVRTLGDGVMIKLSGVESRTEADRLKGAFLYVPPEQAVRPPQGSYFVHEIVGMSVRTEEGRAVGVVSDVVKLPAGDAWVVSANGREIMIPAVREFVRSVDLDGRTVTIHTIEGLLE